jgi:hypothetical protein
MESDYKIMIWNDIKVKLKLRYPCLTNADLVWRHGNQEDLLEMIANKLRIPYNDMLQIVNAL